MVKLNTEQLNVEYASRNSFYMIYKLTSVLLNLHRIPNIPNIRSRATIERTIKRLLGGNKIIDKIKY